MKTCNSCSKYMIDGDRGYCLHHQMELHWRSMTCVFYERKKKERELGQPMPKD